MRGDSQPQVLELGWVSSPLCCCTPLSGEAPFQVSRVAVYEEPRGRPVVARPGVRQLFAGAASR